MRTQHPTTLVQIHVTCDLCHQLLGLHLHACLLCGKDLCSSCAVHSNSEYDDPLHGCNGDYPPYFCPACWSAGQPFRLAAQALVTQHDRQLDLLRQQWSEAACPQP